MADVLPNVSFRPCIPLPKPIPIPTMVESHCFDNFKPEKANILIDPINPLCISDLEKYVKTKLPLKIECKINEFLERIIGCERAFIIYPTDVKGIIEIRAFGMEEFHESSILNIPNKGITEGLYNNIPMFSLRFGKVLARYLIKKLRHSIDSFLAVPVKFQIDESTFLFCLLNKKISHTTTQFSNNLVSLKKVKIINFRKMDYDYIKSFFSSATFDYDLESSLELKDVILISLGEKLLNQLKSPNVIDIALIQLRNTINTQAVSLYIWDSDSDELTVRICGKTAPENFNWIKGNISLKLNSEATLFECMRRREFLNSNIGYKLSKYETFIDSLADFTTINFLMVPIHSEDKVYGVIELSNKRNSEEFTYFDQKLSSEFCAKLIPFLIKEKEEINFLESFPNYNRELIL